MTWQICVAVGRMKVETWDQLGSYCRNPVKEWQRHELEVLVAVGSMCVWGRGSISGSRCCGDRLKKYLGVVTQLHWAQTPASYCGQPNRPLAWEPWDRLGILEWYLTIPKIELYWQWIVNSNLVWEHSQRSSTQSHVTRGDQHVNRAQHSTLISLKFSHSLGATQPPVKFFFILFLPGRPQKKIPLSSWGGTRSEAQDLFLVKEEGTETQLLGLY